MTPIMDEIKYFVRLMVFEKVKHLSYVFAKGCHNDR